MHKYVQFKSVLYVDMMMISGIKQVGVPLEYSQIKVDVAFKWCIFDPMLVKQKYV